MDVVSMIFIKIGAIFAIIGILIKPSDRFDTRKISKWNFIVPTIGILFVSIGLLIRVFVQYG